MSHPISNRAFKLWTLLGLVVLLRALAADGSEFQGRAGRAEPDVSASEAKQHGVGGLTADFSWSPVLPTVGQAVQFTAEAGDVVSAWTWNFGDGDHLTAQRPFAEHVYDAPGEYVVSVRMPASSGATLLANHTVTVLAAPGIQDAARWAYLVPAVAHVDGANNTVWVSDVVLHNPGSASAQGFVYLCRTRTDNRSSEGIRFEVGGGQSLGLADVVARTFHEVATVGSLVVASSGELLVSSRTYNDAADGTYGQYVSGCPTLQAIADEEEVRLVQLTRDSGYRTNLGFANATGDPLELVVSVHRADGSLIGSTRYTLDPYGHRQDNDVIGRMTAEDVGDAYARVVSHTAGARFFAYASVVDNRTGDPVFVAPVSSGTEASVAARRLALSGAVDECPALAGFFDLGAESRAPTGVVVTDGYAYLSDSFGLSIFDIGDPANPILTSRLLLGKQVGFDLAVGGGRAYLARATSPSSAAVHVVDVSAPDRPVLLGSTPVPGGWQMGVDLAGDLLYVTASNSQLLMIVDVSDPSDPRVVGSLRLAADAASAYDVVVEGSTAFVASRDFYVVDVTDSAEPVIIGSVATPGVAVGVALSGTTAIVADGWTGGLQVVDVSDPTAPRIVGSVTSVHGSGVEVVGRRAFLVDGTSRLHVVDVADPAHPTVLGTVDTEGAYAVSAEADLVGVTGGGAGARLVDVSDPAAPEVVAVVERGSASAVDVAARGGVLYVASTGGGLIVVDVSDPSAPVDLGDLRSLGAVDHVAIDGDLGVVLGDDRIGVLDLSSPTSPTLVGELPVDLHPLTSTKGVDLASATAYVADYEAGFMVVDLSNPRQPRIRGRLHFHASDVAVSGSLAYVPNGYVPGANDLVWVVDVTDPAAPDAVGVADLGAGGGWVTGIAASGTLALATYYPAGENESALYVIDATDPSEPVAVATLRIPGVARDVAAVSDRAYVAGDWAGLLVVDVSNPRSPVLESAVRTRKDATALAVSEGTATAWLASGPLVEGVVLCGYSAAPQARFSWRPSRPRADEDVQFFDLSSGPPDSWAWDFGDGGVSAERNPTHRYAAAGTYQVTLHVANERGADVAAAEVDVLPAEAVSTLYIAASAALTGAAGTNWRTDLEVHNPGSTAAEYDLQLLERDAANPHPQTASYTLAPGRSVRYPNLLHEVFQYSGAAAVGIQVHSGDGIVTSRTYNDQPEGTFGQFIAAVRGSLALEAGEAGRMTQLAQIAGSGGSRTNLGLLNVTSLEIAAEVELYASDGTLLGTRTYTLRDHEYRQIGEIFSTVTSSDVVDGHIRVRTGSEGGRFIAYASVVDNDSGDPMYVPAQRSE